jgi:LysM repeat protein
MITVILISIASFTPADSLRTEVINGKTFIIHRVETKETLFSISRKYGVALLSVVENNPGADSGLDIGQEIKVPYSANNRSKTKEGTIHRVGQKETLYSIAKQYGVAVDDLKSWNNLSNAGLKLGQELLIKDKNTDVKVVDTRQPETKLPETKIESRHTVAAGETMYAIARKYGVTVSQIKDWNRLGTNDLKPGQEIVVADPSKQSMTVNQSGQLAQVKTEQRNVVIANEQPPVVSSENNNRSNVVPVTPVVVGTDETRESGMATILDGTEGNRKYLAHHRTVRPGTIIRVKNNITRKEVFVRVIGNLPSNESPDVLLRLSKSAYDKLGGDGKFAVEVTYFK